MARPKYSIEGINKNLYMVKIKFNGKHNENPMVRISLEDDFMERNFYSGFWSSLTRRKLQGTITTLIIIIIVVVFCAIEPKRSTGG